MMRYYLDRCLKRQRKLLGLLDGSLEYFDRESCIIYLTVESSHIVVAIDGVSPGMGTISKVESKAAESCIATR